MCVNIEVCLPTIEKFLLLFSLRSGSILVFFLTTIKSLFCIIFFSSAILEALIGEKSPFGGSLAESKQETEHIHVVYYTLILLMLCESIILVFMLYLATGLFGSNTNFLNTYLLSRSLTIPLEILGLVVMCSFHKLLIGWYLGILLFAVLELYSFIVVFSYYTELLEIEKE